MDRGWSIESCDWEALERVLPSTEAWNSALLTMNDQALVPEGPGVYAICAPPPTVTRQDNSTLFDRLVSPSTSDDQSRTSSQDLSLTVVLQTPNCVEPSSATTEYS